MALIKCADCGKDVSEHARECPNCGCPVEYSISKMKDLPTQEPVAAPIVPPERPAVQSFTPEIPEKKRSGAGKIIAIVAVFAILIVALVPILMAEPQPPAYTDPPFFPDPIPTPAGSSLDYITSRSVDYDSANNVFRVFFGFTNADGVYQTAKRGTASITIYDNASQIVYSKQIPFTSSDFGSWSNPTWGSSRTLVCIYIDPADLTPATSTKGTLTLQVDVDSLSFPSNTMNINNLPVRDLSLQLPSLPRTFNDYDYKDNLEATVRVDAITYDCTVYDYNNVQLLFHVQSTMLFNSTPGVSKYVYVGYKLRNSAGIIVDSGTINIKQSDTGDTSLTDFYVFNLNMLESYTLELSNSVD